MPDAYIVSAARTPIGRFGGALKHLSPADLGAIAMRAALERAGLSGDRLDLYIFGNVLRAGHGQLIPRQAALKAGIPLNVDGYAVDMVCSSGMMSLINAAAAIRAGDADLVLAGGVESMSQAGFFLTHRARWGYKLLLGKPEPLQDILMFDGLTDPTTGEAMGEQTERLAAEHGITADALNNVAYHSHRRAAAATENGWFNKEIAPIKVATRTGTQTVDADEGIRPDTTPESLAALRPAFKKDGRITAGNSSQISDGAAALIVAGSNAIEQYGLIPLARIMGGAWAAGETWRFPEAPIPAAQKLLARLGMQINDFDLFENNEAFAINNILFTRMLGVPADRLNVYGGAVALGHPIGCSGARIVVTLLNALTERDQTRGLAAICHGVGGGTALAIERV
ncbi:MAG: thiolase family protein [Anaerolineae bacterium]